MNNLPKLMPHSEIKGLYLAHVDGTYVGEICRLKENRFLVRSATRKNLSEFCATLSDAQRMLANQR